MPEKERKEVKKMKKGMTKAYRCSETPPRGGLGLVSCGPKHPIARGPLKRGPL